MEELKGCSSILEQFLYIWISCLTITSLQESHVTNNHFRQKSLLKKCPFKVKTNVWYFEMRIEKSVTVLDRPWEELIEGINQKYPNPHSKGFLKIIDRDNLLPLIQLRKQMMFYLAAWKTVFSSLRNGSAINSRFRLSFDQLSSNAQESTFPKW